MDDPQKYKKNLWYLSYYGSIGLQILANITNDPEGFDYSIPEKYVSILEDVLKDYDLVGEAIGESVATYNIKRKFWKKVEYVTSVPGLPSLFDQDIKDAGALKIISYSICKTKEELIEKEAMR